MTPIPDSLCTQCKRKLPPPEPSPFIRPQRVEQGSVRVCPVCAHLMILGGDLTARNLTDRELNDLKRTATWAEVKRRQTAVLEQIAARRVTE